MRNIDKHKGKNEYIHKLLGLKGINIVTVAIAVTCADGIVIGADRKVTMSRGTRIKSLENKIYTLSFKDGKHLLVCGAGSTDHARRSISAINPINVDSMGCSAYRDMVESTVSRLRASLNGIGLVYDATLLFGMIDDTNKPVIGHITTSGLTELKEDGYFTAGIAAPYAEIVLKDSYSPKINIEDAKLIVGGLINTIGKVDNDVEGMDVFYISTSENIVKALTWSERQALEDENMFSIDFRRDVDKVKERVNHWDDLLAKPTKPTKPED